MRSIDVVTDDLQIGERIALELRGAHLKNVRVVSGLSRESVSHRVIADAAAHESGLVERLEEAVRSAYARLYFGAVVRVETRLATADQGPLVRVEIPTEHAMSLDQDRKIELVAPSHRLTVWGPESVAHDTLRYLERLKVDYELGPSTWDGESAVVLFGGAPDALIDKIIAIVSTSVVVALSRRNCWSVDEKEIRVLLPDVVFPTETRLELSTMKYVRWACDFSKERMAVVFRAAGELGVQLDADASVAPALVLGAPFRVNVGLAAIRRAVLGRPLSLRQLSEGLRNKALGPAPLTADDEVAPSAAELKDGSWVARLGQAEIVALLWAIGEVGSRMARDPELDPRCLRRDAIRANGALAALGAAVSRLPLSMAELEEAFRIGKLARRAKQA